MLVIVMNGQLLSPQKVCQTCLLASQSGQPRWNQGRLWCGQAVHKLNDHQPDEYECQMGFRVANIQ
jgi:hypothetical protein